MGLTERLNLNFGCGSDPEFSLSVPNGNPIGRLLRNPDLKPAFFDEMASFRKASRFQRDYRAIIIFRNVDNRAHDHVRGAKV